MKVARIYLRVNTKEQDFTINTRGLANILTKIYAKNTSIEHSSQLPWYYVQCWCS